MRPFGFDKRAYAVRGLILAILLVGTGAYWEKWFRGSGSVWPAIVVTLVSTLLILFSEHKRYLLILAFRMLGALGFLGVLRTLVTDEPVLPGIIVLAVVLGVMILLGAHRRDTKWLFREDALGDNTASLELNLRSAVPQGSKSHGDSDRANKDLH